MKTTWYQKEIATIETELNTSERGLTSSEAVERLEEYGLNKFGEQEKINKMKILLNQFASPLIYILLIAAVITAILHEYVDTGVILVVVIINAVIGYFQEFKAEEGMQALKRYIIPKARAFRDGKLQDVGSESLIPGDVVLIASGTRVPADLRIIGETELTIDEAMLTGESVSSSKTSKTIIQPNLPPGDQKNMAFMGTTVVKGRGKGIVVSTGRNTVLGSIAEDVRQIVSLKTPLKEKLERFGKMIGVLILGLSLVVFMVGLFKGEDLAAMFIRTVAIAVSATPEGLPIAVTIAMAIGVARMARRGAIIRKLPAVETLGNTTVICSDKTGTLTKNEMTVKMIFDGERIFEVEGTGYDPAGDIIHNGAPIKAEMARDLEHALRIGLLCNESDIDVAGGYKLEGDPTEGALIISAIKGGLDIGAERDDHPQLAMLPFESERGYMATLHRSKDKNVLFVKGSPERILDFCSDCIVGEKPRAGVITSTANDFAERGYRVLAMAFKELPSDVEGITPADIESGLVFAGLQGMMDPPRPEAIKAIEGCMSAGIRVIMVTGDHAATAMAVSRQLGIGGQAPQVLRGVDLSSMDDNELREKVKTVSVFARVSPQDKLRITQSLVDQGEIVTVTGDGVNDAPAIKAAHIGVAMGLTGTDVTKDASDMVVTDDNFSTIFAAVEEGRVVYDNIRKVTLFLLSCGIGELMTIIGLIVLGYVIPYTPAQILWLNLVTNGFQDVALAFEPAEKGILTRPPRNPKESILSRSMVESTLLMGCVMAIGTGAVFMISIDSGISLEKARTMALTTMVFFQFYQALNCRSERLSVFTMNPLSNRFLISSMIAAFIAQMAFIYLPPFQWLFKTVSLKFEELLLLGAISTSILIVVELTKYIRRRTGKVP